MGSCPEGPLISSDGAAEGTSEVVAESAKELEEGLRGGVEGGLLLQMDLATPVTEEESDGSLPFSLESKRCCARAVGVHLPPTWGCQLFLVWPSDWPGGGGLVLLKELPSR